MKHGNYNWMIVALIVIVILILAMVFWPQEAEAQSSGSASANTNSSITSNTDARTYIDGRTLLDQRGGGDSTIRNAPQVSAPSMSSGHPCAFTPASASISIIGGGIGAGGQTVDNACLLAQMGEKQSALNMIAARDPAACRALVRSGRISANSYCGDSPSKGNEAPVAATKSGALAGVTCGRTSSGSVEVRVKRSAINAGVTRAQAIAYCGG